jgi:hypothetical protein
MNSSFVGSSKTGKTEWLTPKSITDALGPFDLDPCSPINRPWDVAKTHLTIANDGLHAEWFGRVWINPPFDKIDYAFDKAALHGNALGICYASTETQWFDRAIWQKAYGLLFLKGRMAFYHVDGKKGGSPGKGVCIPAWNLGTAYKLESANRSGLIPGHFQRLR